MTELILEIRPEQADETFVIGAAMVTPPIDEDYWRFRVMVSDKQAIVGFPKFTTIGIGFAIETDWNTNLPYTCDAEKIYDHIKHNCGERIAKARCIAAIRLVQDAARAEAVKKE